MLHVLYSYIYMIFSGGSVLYINALHIMYTLGTTRNKCTRVCLATESNFYYYTFGKMEDGTPCPPTDKGYTNARCVRGNCVVS